MIALWVALFSPASAGPLDDLSEDPPEELVSRLLSHQEELLAAVAQYDPQQHARMLRLREVDREAYLAALLRVARAVERARSDPAAAERRLAIRAREEELARLVRGFEALAVPEQRARRQQIEAAASALMDLKQAERRARLDELRVRLEELEREIAARESERSRIVREYVDRLLAEEVDL